MNDFLPYDNEAMDQSLSLRDEVQRLKALVSELSNENQALRAKLLLPKIEGSGLPSPDGLY